jgi:hypothetical protein
MKITSFNPMIVSKDAESIISLFEELGFEKKHQPVTDTGSGDTVTTRMKDANGFYIDIAGWDGAPQDITEIRMNVDDFEEAYEIFKSHGFENTRGDATVDLKTSKTAVMRSPSGFKVALVKHIK